VNPQVGAVACEPGDLFLLCTDGLVDGLYDSHILEILQISRPFGPDSNPAQRLVHTAVNQAGRDNTTALVVEAR
jgi:protein phosphatase